VRLDEHVDGLREMALIVGARSGLSRTCPSAAGDQRGADAVYAPQIARSRAVYERAGTREEVVPETVYRVPQRRRRSRGA
jgi:hypothetical protein